MQMNSANTVCKDVSVKCLECFVSLLWEELLGSRVQNKTTEFPGGVLAELYGCCLCSSNIPRPQLLREAGDLSLAI